MYANIWQLNSQMLPIGKWNYIRKNKVLQRQRNDYIENRTEEQHCEEARALLFCYLERERPILVS